jgi:hypothetical protein
MGSAGCLQTQKRGLGPFFSKTSAQTFSADIAKIGFLANCKDFKDFKDDKDNKDCRYLRDFKDLKVFSDLTSVCYC